MAASNETIREVLKVLRKHLTSSQIDAVLRDLKKVKGNASFTTTIKNLFYFYAYSGDPESRKQHYEHRCEETPDRDRQDRGKVPRRSRRDA